MTIDSDEPDTLFRYKYLPFSDGSLKMITEGTMKFTCPLEFNDPFDCMPAYDPASIEHIHITRPDLIDDVARYHGISTMDATLLGIENSNKCFESGEFVRDLVASLGVMSLSRVATNVLMWSHYAEHHKGFVVELQIPLDTPIELLQTMAPFPVEYTPDRPVFEWGGGCNITEYFFTKSIDWAYEEEERILTTDQGPGIHPYSRSVFLKSVIAGARMSLASFDQLRAAVNVVSDELGRTVPLYRAELARDKYKVYVPGHPDPEVGMP